MVWEVTWSDNILSGSLTCLCKGWCWHSGLGQTKAACASDPGPWSAMDDKGSTKWSPKNVHSGRIPQNPYIGHLPDRLFRLAAGFITLYDITNQYKNNMIYHILILYIYHILIYYIYIICATSSQLFHGFALVDRILRWARHQWSMCQASFTWKATGQGKFRYTLVSFLATLRGG